MKRNLMAALLAVLVLTVTSVGSRAQEYGHADDDRKKELASKAISQINKAVRGKHGNSISLNGIVAPLAAKAREIQAACGSKVVSAIRVRAKVFGGSPSNHASGMAVDLQGNPSCIYAHLHGWPGGVSVDYATVTCPVKVRGVEVYRRCPHVHLSYNPGGMEWGLRFNHHHPKERKR